MKHVLNPPNALMLMESTRAVGYTLQAAVADIIDNSIAARAQNIDIFFSSIDDPYFVIIDDGEGMSQEELYCAMKYGSKNPTDKRDGLDLGRFGLGLKTASLSQCKILTVASKKDNKINAYSWDLNYIRKNNDWYLLQLDDREISDLPNFNELSSKISGTLVIWTDLDKLSVSDTTIQDAFRDKIPLVRDHLSLVFHRYLSGESGIKRINIKTNGLEVDRIDPFLKNKSQQIMDIENVIINNSVVNITPYILPHQSNLSKDDMKKLGGKEGLSKSQGFYVYRNKRLLVSGTWFRLVKTDDLSKLARVQVDIPNTLDEEWTLDIKKSIAIPPDSVKRNLKRIVDRIANTSKRVYSTRGKKENDSSKIQPWLRVKLRDSSIAYEINRDYSMIEALTDGLQKNQCDMLEQILRFIELGLPIHSIRIDINNEKNLALESRMNTEEQLIYSAVKNMFNETNDISSLKDALLITEPFTNFKQIIEKVFKEMTND